MPITTVPAAAPGLPTARRSFLRGLVSLPLIGGGVTLIGNPTAAAVPVTSDLVDAYDEWLHMERRLLCIEKYGAERAQAYERFIPCTPAKSFHFPHYPVGWRDVPTPSTRAALVLSAVGADWRGES